MRTRLTDQEIRDAAWLVRKRMDADVDLTLPPPQAPARNPARQSVRYKPSPCPHCGKTLDAATACFGGERELHPGAISICMDCDHLQIFDDNLAPRELTAAERAEIEVSPEIQDALEVMRLARAAARKTGVFK